jgi:hypothetical protein
LQQALRYKRPLALLHQLQAQLRAVDLQAVAAAAEQAAQAELQEMAKDEK